MNGTAHARTTKRIWMLVFIGLAAMASVACGGDSASDSASGSSAGVAAGGSENTVGNAPRVTGETFSHGPFSLELNEGKPVLVNFWFPSCPPCRAEMPDLQVAFEKYGDQVAFIGIQQLGLDSPSDGAAFFEELELTYPSLPDTNSKIQFAFEVFSFPTTVFLDKNHDIARKWTGLISEEDLEEQLAALLAG
ncbi:MAG: TlpA disulfide reductase family protein [Chloroflexi bacterium]|nr:TlpA disulfide reductase family protein [Chloroflexota bacterium]